MAMNAAVVWVELNMHCACTNPYYDAEWRTLAAQIKMTVSFRYLALVAALCYFFVHESSCQTSISNQDQQELLNAHNRYRGIITPTASDMQTVSVAESNLKNEDRLKVAMGD